MSSAIFPYIHFDGTCSEAMPFYAGVFGATDLQMMRYNQAPSAEGPGGTSDRVMHSQMTAMGSTLMASDYPPGMGAPQSGMSIMLAPATMAEAKRLYDALAEGGEIVHAFGPTFFSPGFGMMKDRFGTHWIVGAAAA
jgi:PhnB protein